MASADVKQSGKLDNEEDIPSAVHFEKASTECEEEKMTYPNDPQDYPDLVSNNVSEVQDSSPGSKELIGQTTSRSRHQARGGRCPPSCDEVGHRAESYEPTQQSNGACVVGSRDAQTKTRRTHPGSESSFKRPPVHPQQKPSARRIKCLHTLPFRRWYHSSSTRNDAQGEAFHWPRDKD